MAGVGISFHWSKSLMTARVKRNSVPTCIRTASTRCWISWAICVTPGNCGWSINNWPWLHNFIWDKANGLINLCISKADTFDLACTLNQCQYESDNCLCNWALFFIIFTLNQKNWAPVFSIKSIHCIIKKYERKIPESASQVGASCDDRIKCFI